MRLKRISVSNLFNVFDHPIDLNLDEHITIIHGPNGFGKTVILRMLDGLFNAKFGIFRSVPFDNFQVEFTDGRKIRLEQHSSINDDGREEKRILLYSPDQSSAPFEFPAIDREGFPIPLSAIEDVVPNVIQTGPREWIERSSGEAISLEGIVDRYSDYLPDMPYRTPDWLREIRADVPIHFIQTERLTSRAARPRFRSRSDRFADTSSTVLLYSQELANSIQETLARSVEFSSSLDRSFPSRLMNLIKRGDAPKFDEDELRNELVDLEGKSSRLMEAGLLERGEVAVDIPEESLSPEMLKVLSMYVIDVGEKLSLFDSDQTKIELMRRMINRRFLYKELEISKQEGFIFRTPRGNTLSPASLSSGEQHEIVLLYELLFRVPPNSLILIDEPEISLHIAWQQLFLKDLIEITRIADIDALIATHSPDIVSDRWDLTVELSEPPGQRSSNA